MKRKGVALIAVIVMIVLFSSLILVVVLSATMAIRRANYYKDKMIALEIAENGLQKILYKMNYEKYGNGPGALYPFGNNPTGVLISIPNYYPNYPSNISYTQYDTDIDVSEFGKKAECKVSLIDANLNTSDPTTYDTDLDILIVTGKYKGRTTRIMCRIRGANQAEGDLDGTNYDAFSPPRTKKSCGISEAFNKHVIYTETLGPSTIPNTVEINGNILADNWPTTINATGKKTYTDATFLSPTLSDEIKSSLNSTLNLLTTSITIPSEPSPYDDEYDNSGNRIQGDPTGSVNSISDGVWWDGTTYHFGTDDGTNQSTYGRSNNSVRITNANAILRFGVNINNYFKCEGSNITLENGSFSSNTCLEANSITINNGTIQGPVILKSSTINLNGNSTINENLILNSSTGSINLGGTSTISFNNGNLIIKDSSCNLNSGAITINNGIIISNSDLTINNQLTINTNTNNNKSAILLVSSVNINLTIDSSSQTRLNLGENQISGIIIYSNGGSTTTNLYSSLSDITKTDTQTTIISYSETNSSEIQIRNNSTSNDLTVNGLIYSYSPSSNSNITVEGSTSKKTIINGILVAKNVEINQNSVLNYDSNSFKNSVGDVFIGFVGGRRKYLPVPGSWRIEW